MNGTSGPRAKSCLRHTMVASCVVITGLLPLWEGIPGQHRLIAADKAKIDDAIRRGQQHLLKEPKQAAAGALASYALLKSGIAKDHPEVKAGVDAVLTKFASTGYRGGGHHMYEAGIDAMLLEAVDPVAYKTQLQWVADYIIANQRASGGWHYPGTPVSADIGDTSITQYAILGLWAAARAGVDVPTEVWEKTARWFGKTQQSDGGFAYHPEEPNQSFGNNGTTCNMTMVGAGSLLIIRLMLHGAEVFEEEVRPAAAGKRYGVLERLPSEKEIVVPKVRSKPTLSPGAVDAILKPAVKWNMDNFKRVDMMKRDAPNYFLYGAERFAALLDVEKIGSHDWYNEGADALLLSQRPDGRWADPHGPEASTSFALLFLSKATTTIVTKPPKKAKLVGGGLLIAGRGLPENLDAIALKDGQVAARKLAGPVDGMLAELEKSSEAKVESVQAAIVEAVQLDRPEELIGQVSRLKRLATDARVEVRRTAMWALGRSGDITTAPILIKGLSDSSEDVVRESSFGLSLLSRRPDGCGLPLDPTDGLAEDASDADRQAHLARWQKETARLWNQWYLQVRPYDERDDRTSFKAKP